MTTISKYGLIFFYIRLNKIRVILLYFKVFAKRINLLVAANLRVI